MHYSFLFPGDLGQIDLHFEPNFVFTYLKNGNKYFPENKDQVNNSNPFESGSLGRVLTEFKIDILNLSEFSVLIIRVTQSNSAKWMSAEVQVDFERFLILEFGKLGLNSMIFEDVVIQSFVVNPNA